MNKLKGKRIFISGGAGVIGQEMVRKLNDRGAIIFVGDLKPRPKEFGSDILYRQGDLNDITEVELDFFKPEVFFHLAASFERSVESHDFWEENYRNNVNLSHHLMTLLRDKKWLKKVIFAASYLAYDKQLYSFEKWPIAPARLKEQDRTDARNLTGSAKLNHEIELKFIAGFRKDLKIILPRIYRGFGCGSRDVISRWIRALLKGEPIDVYHEDNIFDYIYAGDSAEGMIRLAENNFEGVVNLGTGNARRVTEVIEILKKHFPRMKIRYHSSNYFYEGSEADTSLLQKVANWHCQYDLEKGIEEIIAYEKKAKKIKLNAVGNVLVTSISKKVPLLKAVRKAMAKIGMSGKLFGGDVDKNCIGRFFVDQFWLMPKTDNDHKAKILKFCLDHNIKFVIPTRDGEILFWSKYIPLLKKHGINIMVSNKKAILETLDKLVFYQKGKSYGFPMIKTAMDINDIKEARLVVKERYGAGSIGLGLNLSVVEALRHAEKLAQPVFQPFIKGREYSVDVYVSRKGRAKGAVVRERNIIVGGESQVTTVVSLPKLAKLCMDFSKRKGLYGHQVFQALQDKRGRFHLIECNCRFGGASTLSLAAGLDSFYWFFMESLGEDIENYAFIKGKPGLRQVRFNEDVVRN